MPITSHKNLLIVLFLSIIISVSSLAVKQNVQKETSLIRQRRQQAIPILLEGLIPGLELVLEDVKGLIDGLELPVAEIVVALGLPGLALPLVGILNDLGTLVGELGRKKRRDAISVTSIPNPTGSQAIAAVTSAQNAVTTINGLKTTANSMNVTAQLTTVVTQMTAIKQAISSGSATGQTVQTDLNPAVLTLTGAVGLILSAVGIILAAVPPALVLIVLALDEVLSFIAGLPLTLTPTQLATITSILRDVATAQNATLVNTVNLYSGISTIYNATVQVLSQTTTVFANTTSSALVSSCAGK